MNNIQSSDRRHFLRNLSLATGALLTSSAWAEAFVKKGDLKIGYSAITWGGKDL
jgi:inosose dehydratase